MCKEPVQSRTKVHIMSCVAFFAWKECLMTFLRVPINDKSNNNVYGADVDNNN